MKLQQYATYEQYVESQRRTVAKRSAGPFFTWLEIERICDWLKRQGIRGRRRPVEGICHGARDGIELDEFAKHFPKSNVIGTDLFPYSSPAAPGKSLVIEHDFSVQKEEWVGAFDFVYSNSIDHVRDPIQTIRVWLDQAKPNGFLLIQWNESDRKVGGGDCFAVELMELIHMLNRFGRVVDLIYTLCPRNRRRRLQRRGLETVVVAVGHDEKKR